MLHEILLGLLGVKGGVIEEINGEFRVRGDCDFLTGPEKELVNRVLWAASHFKYLERFVGKHFSMLAGLKSIFHMSAAEDDEEPTGLYLKSYSAGVKILLENYKTQVLGIEQEHLQGGPVSVAGLLERTRLDELAAVVRVTKRIQLANVRGGQLLDIVNTEEFCPSLQDMIRVILRKLLQVFFHQLVSWCAHGQLLDSFGEFFIKQQEGAEWNNRFGLQLEMLPISVISARVAEKVLFIGKAVQVLGTSLGKTEAEEFVQGLRHVQGAFSKLLLSQVIERIRRSVSNRLWNLVVVKSDLLSHIKALKNYYLLSRGEFILTFLEESRDMMRLPPKLDLAENDINQGPFANAQNVLEEDPYLARFRFVIKSAGFNFPDFQHSGGLSFIGNCKKAGNVLRLVSNRFSRTPGALWHSRKQQVLPGFSTQFALQARTPCCFYFMLQAEREVSISSQHPPLKYNSFENGLSVKFTLESRAAVVELELCRATVTVVTVPVAQDTYNISIQVDTENIRVSLNNALCIEAAAPLQKLRLDVGASAYIGIGAEHTAELRSWGFSSITSGVQAAVFDSWSGLGLQYTPEWPLDLIFSQQVLDKYNALFKFLFTLKRAQFLLQRAWLARYCHKGTSALQLRSEMNFIIDNFITFLQVDVIECHFTRLVERIGRSEDFEEIRQLHDEYVAKMATDCFLHVPKNVRAVQEIARNCHDLCTALEQGQEIETVRSRFEAETVFVFGMLSSIRSQHPALGQLLLRLNFNEYLARLKKRKNPYAQYLA